MLYFVGAWTFLTVVCFSIGIALLNALKADCFKRSGDRFFAAVWVGVVILAIFLLAASVVFPLSPLVGLAIALALASLSFLSHQTRAEIVTFCSNFSRGLISGFLMSEVVVANLTTQQVTWYDAGLYHLGAIRWLAEYGAVPGLALINSKFGFTSSWFALAAPLNPEIFGTRVSAVTNGFVFLIFCWHFFIVFSHVLTKNGRLYDWLLTIFSLITIPIFIFTTFMSAILLSPSPDIPVILLTGVIGWAMLILLKDNSSPLHKEKTPVLEAHFIPLLLSIGAVTMKLSALPLLVVSFFFMSLAGNLI